MNFINHYIILTNIIFVFSSFTVLETTPCNMSAEIRYETSQPSFLIIKFDKKIFPYIQESSKKYNFKLLGIWKEKKHNYYALSNTSKNPKKKLKFKCDKLLSKISDYGWDDERGVKSEFYVLSLEGKFIQSNIGIVDLIYVPDFTVVFMAISTCGWIFTLIFRFYVRKALTKVIVTT